MAFRILNQSERENIHQMLQAGESFDSSNYNQNDEGMQKRLLLLQALVSTGLSLSALALWLSANIR